MEEHHSPRPVIEVNNVHKSFKLPHEKHAGLRQKILSMDVFGSKKYETQYVLKGLDFSVNEGDFYGIIGRNGSGKSTLLKILAGIYQPSKGSVAVHGKLTPFIELGVGFNHELTGRENIFLNGALMGFSRKEMEAKYDDIVAFSELEKFMDQKLKNYSSGMLVRLAFSLAIQSQSDILLFDEVLAVGDSAFQRKCRNHFRDLRNSNKTVVLVTHDMQSVREYCNKALLIADGEIKLMGSPSEVADLYTELNTQSIEEGEKKVHQKAKVGFGQIEEDGANIKSIKMSGSDGEESNILRFGDTVTFTVTYQAEEDIAEAVIDFAFRPTIDTIATFATNTRVENMPISLKKGEEITFTCTFKAVFGENKYYVATSLYDPISGLAFARHKNELAFEIVSGPRVSTQTYIDHKTNVSIDGGVHAHKTAAI